MSQDKKKEWQNDTDEMYDNAMLEHDELDPKDNMEDPYVTSER